MNEETTNEVAAADESLLSDNVTPAVEGQEAPAWQWTDGQPGDGDRPEWLREKYGTVEAQAQAYVELERKLGTHTGTPDAGYELKVPEGLSGDLLEDSPLRTAIEDVCREGNVNQEFYEKLTTAYLTGLAVENTTSKTQELEALGAEGPQVLKDLQSWGQANLTEQDYETMQGLCVSAEAVKFFKVLTNKLNSSNSIPANEAQVPMDGLDEKRLHAMLADPRWADNSVYQAEVMLEFEKFYGTE